MGENNEIKKREKGIEEPSGEMRKGTKKLKVDECFGRDA